ncbi:DurN family substrate-assisted peptide maturase [Actinomadura atramentaria]|uniref:DurN family substrate-assisted peptide maturase n=1 Tax=Actinomadura atramentaria TaxID=1990 RepID=UPI000375CE9A|nr:DurN family substrate-assisted peptide maturase [Actinomadura atramentaria]
MRSGPKPPSDLTKHRNIDTVRQLQHLVLLCSLTPPGTKLHELLTLALNTDERGLPERVSPVQDLHPQTTKTWLEGIWNPELISADEMELVAWQNNKAHMDVAVDQIQRIERRLGIRLATEKIS